MTHVIHPLGVLLFTGGAFLIGMRLEGIVWGFVLSTGLACGLMLHWTMRLFPELWHLKKGCLFASSRILPYSIKVLFNDFLHRVLSHTDRLMLGAFGAASEVGIYSMSAFMGSKIDFFQGTFNSIFAPTIADLYSRGQYRELVRIFQTVTKWTLVLTLPVFFACLFLGHFLLELFGREFQAGWSTLVVLAVANLINIGVGPVGYMLVMTERPGLEFFNSWIAGVTNILLNLWLIPRYGALGAAIATGSSIAMVNLLRLVQVQRIHHCHPFRWGTLKVLMAWALAGGTVWTLSHAYHLEDWRRLVAMAGFLFAYGGLLTLFGWDEEDKLVLRQLRRKVRVWLA
jgi:O-antigen/teichoic acid export membrane protein